MNRNTHKKPDWAKREERREKREELRQSIQPRGSWSFYTGRFTFIFQLDSFHFFFFFCFVLELDFWSLEFWTSGSALKLL